MVKRNRNRRMRQNLTETSRTLLETSRLAESCAEKVVFRHDCLASEAQLTNSLSEISSSLYGSLHIHSLNLSNSEGTP